jgi:hypothetical protein
VSLPGLSRRHVLIPLPCRHSYSLCLSGSKDHSFFLPPAPPRKFVEGIYDEARGSDTRLLAPGRPARPSRPRLGHQNPIEKHFVLPPTLYAAMGYSLLSIMSLSTLAQTCHSITSKFSVLFTLTYLAVSKPVQYHPPCAACRPFQPPAAQHMLAPRLTGQ